MLFTDALESVEVLFEELLSEAKQSSGSSAYVKKGKKVPALYKRKAKKTKKVTKATKKKVAKVKASRKSGGKKLSVKKMKGSGSDSAKSRSKGPKAHNPFKRFSKLGNASPGKKDGPNKTGKWKCTKISPYKQRCVSTSGAKYKNGKTASGKQKFASGKRVKIVAVNKSWKRGYNGDYDGGHRSGSYKAGSRSGNKKSGLGVGPPNRGWIRYHKEK